MLDLDPTRSAVKPRDAATVIVVRDAHREADTPIEIFFVRRHAKSAYLGGAVVFPGGKLDESDHQPRAFSVRGIPVRAEELESDPTMAQALGLCAFRELLEEAAIALTTPEVDHDVGVKMQASMLQGQSLNETLGAAGLDVDLSALHSFGRWVTPIAETRRFDARFFVARAPSQQHGKHDDHETTSGLWAPPRAMLDAGRRGDVMLAPPTIRCLELMQDAKSAHDVIALASDQCLEPVCPQFVAGPPPMLVLPGDPLHSVNEQRVPGPSRFIIEDGRFVSTNP